MGRERWSCLPAGPTCGGGSASPSAVRCGSIANRSVARCLRSASAGRKKGGCLWGPPSFSLQAPGKRARRPTPASRAYENRDGEIELDADFSLAGGVNWRAVGALIARFEQAAPEFRNHPGQ
ncbi:MAG: hypothetical protein Kow0097_01090 [Candidatus Bipolaricaulota bacterium]